MFAVATKKRTYFIQAANEKDGAPASVTITSDAVLCFKRKYVIVFSLSYVKAMQCYQKERNELLCIVRSHLRSVAVSRSAPCNA